MERSSQKAAQYPTPEDLSKLTTLWGRGIIDLQFEFLAKTATLFDNPPGNGRDASDMWSRFYEEELKPLLNAPQVGLTRYYQERSALLMDKFNSWNNASIEFLRMVAGPLEESIGLLQRESVRSVREKGSVEASKEIYRVWIEQLDSLYQNLLRSPEFVKCLSETLDALEGFVTARMDFVQTIGKALQLPTLKDLDEAYRELYLLKKEVKAMKKERARKGRNAAAHATNRGIDESRRNDSEAHLG